MLDDTYIFANLKENVVNVAKTVVGSTILNKTITYLYGGQARGNDKPPIIAFEDLNSAPKITAELGGKHRLTVHYSIWVYAGGISDQLVNERMKETLKGLLYKAFSNKYSIPFYLYSEGGTVSDYYYSTDISLRNSTPSIYSELDAHKCVGDLQVSIIY